MESIKIHTEEIQLDQLLKWAGIVESGGQVRPMLDEQLILLNGQIETAKRRRIHAGDIIEIKNLGCWQVEAEGKEE